MLDVRSGTDNADDYEEVRSLYIFSAQSVQISLLNSK